MWSKSSSAEIRAHLTIVIVFGDILVVNDSIE